MISPREVAADLGRIRRALDQLEDVKLRDLLPYAEDITEAADGLDAVLGHVPAMTRSGT